MKTVAPNSPSDTAKANPAAISSARRTIGRSTSRHTRRRGQDGGRLPEPSVHRPQHRQHGAYDEGDARQSLRERHQDPGGAQVQRRFVERDQEAEPDGHGGHAERQHQQRVETPYRRPVMEVPRSGEAETGGG